MLLHYCLFVVHIIGLVNTMGDIVVYVSFDLKYIEGMANTLVALYMHHYQMPLGCFEYVSISYAFGCIHIKQNYLCITTVCFLCRNIFYNVYRIIVHPQSNCLCCFIIVYFQCINIFLQGPEIYCICCIIIVNFQCINIFYNVHIFIVYAASLLFISSEINIFYNVHRIIVHA